MRYKFSIVIPHKNTPELLQRLLDSIPQRDDFEVIIVDDNSNPDIVNFKRFPGENRLNTHILFTKEGKGAGYARNVGMEHARGEWIIFADADDFFTENIETLFDEYYSSDADIIYFKHKNVLSDNIQIECTRCHEFNDVMTGNWPDKDKELFFRCRHNVPWAKMIKANFIKQHNIRYEEVHYSNDIVFNITAGCQAKKVQLVNQYIYVLTERQGSLTSGNCQTIDELLQRTEAHIKMQAIIEQYGYYKESPAMWFLPTLYTRSYNAFISALKSCKRHDLSMKKIYHNMVSSTKRGEHPMLVLCFLISILS